MDLAAKRWAFAQMASCHEQDLLRAARRLCGLRHGDEASDLVQETLVRAYESYLREPLRIQGEPNERTRREKAWLTRIMTNHFINEYRRRRKWEAGVTVDDLTHNGTFAPYQELQAKESETPGNRLFNRTLSEALERAIAQLPLAQRVCIVLVDVEGWEYAEAASILDLPVGTVRSRLHRARLQLHSQLEEYARRRHLIDALSDTPAVY